MAKQITVDDHVFQELRAKVRSIGSASVKVGVLQSGRGDEPVEGAKDGLTMAELAAIHEYGAPKAGIPARSFIRRTFAEQAGADALRMFLAKVAKALIAERVEVKQALDMLGTFAVNAIKARIRAQIPPPNKPATIKRKGSSTPLVDSGQLLNSLTWEVKV